MVELLCSKSLVSFIGPVIDLEPRIVFNLNWGGYAVAEARLGSVTTVGSPGLGDREDGNLSGISVRGPRRSYPI